jgi:hypothetical protein
MASGARLTSTSRGGNWCVRVQSTIPSAAAACAPARLRQNDDSLLLKRGQACQSRPPVNRPPSNPTWACPLQELSPSGGMQV